MTQIVNKNLAHHMQTSTIKICTWLTTLVKLFIKSQKLDGNDTAALSHHPYILCMLFCHHLYKNALCLLVVQRRVVEGSGVGSAGCVVHFDVHLE